MKRTNEILVASVVSAALLSGFSNQANEAEAKISPNNPAAQKAFNKAHGYWLAQGVGGIANTQLITLKAEDDVFYCRPEENSTRRSQDIMGSSTDVIAKFCKVESSVALVNEHFEANMGTFIDGGVSAEGYALYIMAHEVGHAVTDARDASSPFPINELRADCFAGSVFGVLASTEVPKILDFFETVLPIDKHGTGKEVKAAIQAGVNDPTGMVCLNYQI